VKVKTSLTYLGAFTYINGDKFQGNWIDGRRQGKGKTLNKDI